MNPSAKHPLALVGFCFDVLRCASIGAQQPKDAPPPASPAKITVSEFAGPFTKRLRAGLAWTLGIVLCLILSSVTAARSIDRAKDAAQDVSKEAEKKPKDHLLFWNPPDVDTRIRSLTAAPECVLSSVLAQAGTRATELVTNLENFTAHERIEYRLMGKMGDQLDSDVGTFDYTAAFEKHKEGVAVQESRTPEHGSLAFPASSQDVGLPEMALVFLPRFQDDYEMKCEGSDEWNSRPVWVVYFRQRKDRPTHTASFNDRGNVYPARFKGRAWIEKESGEVVHLEMSLMGEIAAISVMQWALSIDYGPVHFRARNVQIWLPQSANAYGDFGNRRTIIYHTFSDFQLFSVQTDEVIDKPKTP